MINDRLSRWKVMQFADWARACIVLAMLAVQSSDWLWLLYVLLAMETVCWALFEPASRSVIPNIAKLEEIPVANALASATWSVNFAMGAALGGVAGVVFGRSTVFVLNSLSFVTSALLVRRMKFVERHTQNQRPLHWRDFFDFSPIAEGIAYVRRDSRLMVSMLVKAGVGLMGANWVILPVMGERVFPLQVGGLSASQAGTLGMSVLLGTRGFGAIFGSILGGNFAGSNIARLRGTVLAAFLMCAAGYAGLGFAASMAVAMGCILIAHCGGSAAWTASTTLLQELTEDRFRGRVFSAEFAGSMLTLAVGNFLAGQLADRGVDVRMLAVATGVVMIVPALLWQLSRGVWRRTGE